MADRANLRYLRGTMRLSFRPSDLQSHHVADGELFLGLISFQAQGSAAPVCGRVDHFETPRLRREGGIHLCNGRRGVPSLCTDEIGRQWTDEMAIERAQVGE